MKKNTIITVMLLLFFSFSTINAQTELFTNSNFNTDVNGWSASSNATLTWETGGYAKLTKGAGDAWNSRVGQTVSDLTIGQTYQFKITIIELSGRVRMYNNDSGWMGYISNTGTSCFEFIATQETTLFRWYAYDQAGDYNIVDSISLKEISSGIPTNPTPTYFVDATNGNDSNNGTSEATAWKTLGKVRFPPTPYTPGDVIAFKRGEVFDDIRLYFTQLHGTAANPIVFCAYGSGSMPVITMLKNVNPSWVNDGNNRWHTVVSDITTRLWKNNIELKRTCKTSFQNQAVISYQLPVSESNNVKREFGGTEGAVWIYSSGIESNPLVSGWANPINEKRIYYYSTSMPTGVFKGNSNPYVFGIYNSSFLTIQDLDLQGAAGNTLTINNSNNILVKTCTIGKKSDSGIFLSNSDDVKIEGNSIDADFKIFYTGFLSYKGTDYRGISDGVGFSNGASNNEIKFNDFIGWGHAAVAISAGNSNIQFNKIHHNYISTSEISYGRFFGMSGAANNNEINHNYIFATRTQNQLGGDNNNVHHNVFDTMQNQTFKYGQFGNAMNFNNALSGYATSNNIFSFNTIKNIEGAGIDLLAYNDPIINNTINNNLIINSGEINGNKKSIFVSRFTLVQNNTITNNAIVNSATVNTVYFRGADNLTLSQFESYNGNSLFNVTTGTANFAPRTDVISGNVNYNPNDGSVGAGNLTVNMVGLQAYTTGENVDQCGAALSYTDTKLSNSIQIYPNPATNSLTIKQTQQELKNYTITNTIGQKVAFGIVNNTTIDISNLEKGIYFIKLANDKKSITKKFIKQ